MTLFRSNHEEKHDNARRHESPLGPKHHRQCHELQNHAYIHGVPHKPVRTGVHHLMSPLLLDAHGRAPTLSKAPHRKKKPPRPGGRGGRPGGPPPPPPPPRPRHNGKATS